MFATRPAWVDKPWGGRRLATLPAKQRPGYAPPAGRQEASGDGPAARIIGESWEVSDLPGAESVVDGGPLDGLPLSQLVKHYGAELTGTRGDPARFPLLVKLVDAGVDLSVQVHPDAAYAKAHGVFAKDEAWLVVDAAEDAAVLHGLVPGVTKEKFVSMLQAGTVAQALRRVPVARGDCLHVPPGTFHAILGGVLILEVQEPSDTTFRVWDWGRTDEQGRARALHVDEALAVGHFAGRPEAGPRGNADAQPQALCPPQSGQRRIAGPAFWLDTVVVEGGALALEDGRGPRVVHGISGACVLEGGGGSVALVRGQSAVVPAGCGAVSVRAVDTAVIAVMGTP